MMNDYFLTYLSSSHKIRRAVSNIISIRQSEGIKSKKYLQSIKSLEVDLKEIIELSKKSKQSMTMLWEFYNTRTLYNLRDVSSPIIQDVLNQSGIREKMNRILNKVYSNEDPNNKNLLERIIKSNVLMGNDKIEINDFIIMRACYNEQLCSYELFEKACNELVTSIMLEMGIKEPKVSVIKKLSWTYDTMAQAAKNKMRIRSDLVENLYYDGNLQIIKIICHELIHSRQHLVEGKLASLAKNNRTTPASIIQICGEKTLLMLRQAKDCSIRYKNHKYYMDNYLNYSYELEAMAESNIYYLKFLEANNIDISDKKRETLEKEITRQINDQTNNYRIFKGNSRDLDELFENLPTSVHKKAMQELPVLGLEYKMVNNKLERKSIDEMNQDYSDVISNKRLNQNAKNMAKIIYPTLVEKEKIRVETKNAIARKR